MANPLEFDEQRAFVEWLEVQGLKFTAIPNDTFTRSWKQKNTKRLEGVRAGFPDLVVLIPKNRSKDGEGYCLAIEMKRIKGGVVSKFQKEWIEAINELDNNFRAYVAKGCSEAIEIVKHYLK